MAGLTTSQLLTGLVQVTPLVLQEWQTWTALREGRRAAQRQQEDEERERALAAEARRLDRENEVARAKELLTLRQELAEHKAQAQQLGTATIPILDLLALPDVQALLKQASVKQ